MARCVCQQFFVEDGGCSSSGTVVDGDDPSCCSKLKCPACVQRSLQPHLKLHRQAVDDHRQARLDCSRQLPTRFQNQHHRISELQAESQRLRDRLSSLRVECGDMAVRVASQAVENDSHRDMTLPSVHIPQLQLMRLESTLLDDSMVTSLQTATAQVRTLRFQWARKAFQLHRLDIDPDDVKLTPLQQHRQATKPTQRITRRARGIGKIGGLPLPNAGALYCVLPGRELQSALRLVASVTSTVARCLGILLPHPILLTPNGPSGDITHFVSTRNSEAVQDHIVDSKLQKQPKHEGSPLHEPYGSISSASSSLMSYMDTSYWKKKAKSAAKKAVAKATGTISSTTSSVAGRAATTTMKARSSVSPSSTMHPNASSPSMDSHQVAQRIHHASAAVLADDPSPTASQFVLSSPIQEEPFAIALQLLQNNIVVLCIRAGVPVSKLWPAEAMLLNLHALDSFCSEQTTVSY